MMATTPTPRSRSDSVSPPQQSRSILQELAARIDTFALCRFAVWIVAAVAVGAAYGTLYGLGVAAIGVIIEGIVMACRKPVVEESAAETTGPTESPRESDQTQSAATVVHAVSPARSNRAESTERTSATTASPSFKAGEDLLHSVDDLIGTTEVNERVPSENKKKREPVNRQLSASDLTADKPVTMAASAATAAAGSRTVIMGLDASDAAVPYLDAIRNGRETEVLEFLSKTMLNDFVVRFGAFEEAMKQPNINIRHAVARDLFDGSQDSWFLWLNPGVSNNKLQRIQQILEIQQSPEKALDLAKALFGGKPFVGLKWITEVGLSDFLQMDYKRNLDLVAYVLQQVTSSGNFPYNPEKTTSSNGLLILTALNSIKSALYNAALVGDKEAAMAIWNTGCITSDQLSEDVRYIQDVFNQVSQPIPDWVRKIYNIPATASTAAAASAPPLTSASPSKK